jgi:hypothetical protein
MNICAGSSIALYQLCKIKWFVVLNLKYAPKPVMR